MNDVGLVTQQGAGTTESETTEKGGTSACKYICLCVNICIENDLKPHRILSIGYGVLVYFKFLFMLFRIHLLLY